jgi:hypothetical protein
MRAFIKQQQQQHQQQQKSGNLQGFAYPVTGETAAAAAAAPVVE